MKTYIKIVIFSILFLKGYPSEVYYGYKSADNELKKADKFITNLPDNINGRFTKPEDFDELIKLLETNPTKHFKIEINVFLGGLEKNNLVYSNNLCTSLEKILEFKTSINNFDLISKGSSNAIFLNEDDPNYKFYNTRIEILVD